jgi:hypothetical protein
MQSIAELKAREEELEREWLWLVEALNTIDFGNKVIAIRPNNIRSKYFLGDVQAIMLGALSLKWKWRQRREQARKDTSRPNLVADAFRSASVITSQ